MALPIAIVAILGLTVTFLVVPLRTWMAQRDMVETRSGQYAAYEEVNDALQDEIDALRTPEGVRQAVREQLGYLLPNERRVPLLEMPNASVTRRPLRRGKHLRRWDEQQLRLGTAVGA